MNRRGNNQTPTLGHQWKHQDIDLQPWQRGQECQALYSDRPSMPFLRQIDCLAHLSPYSTGYQRNTRHLCHERVYAFELLHTGETNVCETYSTLYNNRTYSISLKKMIISCIGSPCLHIQCFLLLLGAGYPSLTPVEGEVRFFHALGPAGPFTKRNEQQYFQHTEKHRNDITARQKHSNCTSFCSSP